MTERRYRVTLDAETDAVVRRAAEREGATIVATLSAIVARHCGTSAPARGEHQRRAFRAADPGLDPDRHDDPETRRHP